MKGQNILVCNTSGLTDLFDRVILATGTSNRQTRALAKNVHDKVKQNGGEIFGSEGEDTGEWVLVDCGDAVVHILQPAIRDYYRLEDIWGERQIPLDDVVAAFRLPPPEVKRKPSRRKPLSAKAPVTSAAKTPAKKPAPKKSLAKKG
jgi:ribosome-associated protein